MKTKIFAIGFFILAIMLVSCDKSVVYEENHVFEGSVWNSTDTAFFEFSNSDTLIPLNILISLKNNDNYPFNNIWFFVTTVFPDKKQITDTIDYILQNPRGKWFGLSLGEVYGRYLPYRINRPLPIKGKYTIKICQAMRKENLEGIKNIGLRIEKSKQIKKKK
ncbi:MAG: gliding motility lipoprotein GldH [Bacteroidales bacterium]|nr:gliding motility lipoprotein GldH [Bacteroidales bacterium]